MKKLRKSCILRRLLTIALCAVALGTGSFLMSPPMQTFGAIVSESEVSNQLIPDTEYQYIGMKVKYFDGKQFFNGITVETNINMGMLQQLSFKPMINSAQPYGEIKSKKIVVYENGGSGKVLKANSAGYYTYDTSKPVRYRIKIVIKTKRNNKIYRYFTVDNRAYAKIGYQYTKSGVYTGVYNTQDGCLRVVEHDYMNSYANLYRNVMIPTGSILHTSKLKTLFDKVYIAQYDDYKQNGMSATWEELKGDIKFSNIGTYSLMCTYTTTDSELAGTNGCVVIPHLRVSSPRTKLDMKEVYSDWVRYGLISADTDEKYGILQIINTTEDAYKDGKLYHTTMNYKNPFKLYRLDTVTKDNLQDIISEPFVDGVQNLFADSDLITSDIVVTGVYYYNGEDVYSLPDGVGFKTICKNSLLDLQINHLACYYSGLKIARTKYNAAETDDLKSRYLSSYNTYIESVKQYTCQYNTVKIKYKMNGVNRSLTIYNYPVYG